MAQQSKVLIAIAEADCVVPSTQVRQLRTNYNSNSRESQALWLYVIYIIIFKEEVWTQVPCRYG